MEKEEQVKARHKKEIKALEGEKRATLKKIKGTKGKKGKELQSATETEFDTKLQDLQSKHQQELQALQQEQQSPQKETPPPTTTTTNKKKNEKDNVTILPPKQDESPSCGTLPEVVVSEKERKLEKARRKRQQKLRNQQLKEQQRQQERENDGPDLRDVEMTQIQIQNQLESQHLVIEDIPADGHCLYRSIAAQLYNRDSNHPPKDDAAAYRHIRELCAQGLLTHQEELEPFCELEPPLQTYQEYVENVKSSSDWGGHLELRALHLQLQVPMIVYRGMGLEPLVFGTLPDDEDEDNDNDNTPKIIRLSYHKHYYALGEHYNQVIKRKPEEE
eukprot:CAMPEP_0195283528 /NCGR_PEP_ID=MMETSP0707-20130614/2050_1 /TAXON_ID=33640 /ORGANISM="Asterionellopsis glacialis, Strain CCMP134" /LENGTH=330 /DNA_ID=CAMNT_0040342711 /DNA_START=124 /DNA_END=1116 /DNA_ORIENTATION=+